MKLLEFDLNGKIILNSETLKKITEIEEYVSVVTIIGPYRSGKSYLLNWIAGHRIGFDTG